MLATLCICSFEDPDSDNPLTFISPADEGKVSEGLAKTVGPHSLGNRFIAAEIVSILSPIFLLILDSGIFNSSKHICGQIAVKALGSSPINPKGNIFDVFTKLRQNSLERPRFLLPAKLYVLHLYH